MAVMRPLGTSKVMSWSTVCEPKDLVTPRREMIGSPGRSTAAAVSTGVRESSQRNVRRSAALGAGASARA